MLVTISGHSGCGKSSTAALVAKKLRMKVVDTGEVFRKLAKKRGMDVITFGKYAEKHPEVDHELDDAMLKIAERAPRLLLLGRLTGWMTLRRDVNALRIWMSASPQIRAKRVVLREGIPYREALKGVIARDRDNVARYKKVYGLDLNDTSIYDIVVQTDKLNLEQVVSLISRQIPKIWLKKQQRKTSALKRKR